MRKLITGIITITTLAGCTSFYYGHTQEEWEALSDLEKDKSREKYERVIRAKQELVQGVSREIATEKFIERAVNRTPFK